jgi:hypothetical protein
MSRNAAVLRMFLALLGLAAASAVQQPLQFLRQPV